MYVSTGGGSGWTLDAGHFKEIDRKAHEKTYKKCMKYAKKWTQEDCFLFAIDDKIVWNLDGPKKANEIVKAERLSSDEGVPQSI